MLPLLLGLLFLPADVNSPEIIALTSTASAPPRFDVIAFPETLKSAMLQYTWHAGCPAPLADLQLLSVSYWDFNAIERNGLLIVNRAVASDVLAAFRSLYTHGFMVEKMRPVEEYGGSDDRSMAANNTSAFNCRDVTGKPGRFSNHSWGRAIDINPLTNPMLLGAKVLPPEGARYVDRSKAEPGSILAHSFIVKVFQDLGWTWGGDWKDPDFQHFEKPDPHRP